MAVSKGVPYPQRIEDDFARRVSRRLTEAAMRAYREVVLPALNRGDLDAAKAGAGDVGAAAQTAYPDTEIEKDFADAGEATDKRHSRMYWAGVATATGITLRGSFGVAKPGAAPRRRRERVSPQAAFAASRGVSPRAARGIGVIGVVRPSPGAAVARGEMATDGVRLVSTVRSGMADGLRAQISSTQRAIAAGADKAAEIQKLADKIQESGLPSQIPYRRLKKDGTPVEVSADAHSRLIARDQVGKLQAALDIARANESGATRYVWVTKGDGRERSSHAALSGTVRSYSEGLRPGQDIQCRCHAEPVITTRDVIASSGVVVVPTGPVSAYAEEPLAVARASNRAELQAIRRQARQIDG